MKIVRYLYYLLVIATPFIVWSHTSELFEFNKMMFIYLDTLAIVCTWVFTLVQQKKIVLKWHWIFIPMLLFLVSQILATVFSIDVHTSIFGYYGRFNGGLLSIITYFALFFVLVQVGDKKFIINLLKYSFIAAVGTVLWGLPGKFGYDLSCLVFTGHLTNACWTDQFRPSERMFSTLGQPNWLGAYLVIQFFIGLWFLVKREKFFNRSTLLLAYALVLVFLGVLFTRSRSSLGAWGIGMAVYAIGVYFVDLEKIKRNWKYVAGMVMLFLAAILIFKTGIDKIDNVISFKKAQPVTKTAVIAKGKSSAPAPASNVTDSLDIRKIVWQGAIQLGKEYPFFGTGVETFAYSYYFTRPIAHNYTSEWDFLYNKAHNEFLNYLATTGFIGLGSYILMSLAVCMIFAQMLKQKSKDTSLHLLAVSLLSAYLSIHVTDFFGFSVTTVQIFFYLIPAMALVYTPKLLTTSVEKEFHYGDLLSKTWKGIVILCFTMGIIYLGRYYLADMKYAMADIYSRSGDYNTAYELYQQALVLRYEHVYEDKYSYVLANLAFAASAESDKKLANALMGLADDFNSRTLKASPKNVLYWKTKAKNNYLHYQTTLDKVYLKKAIEAMATAKKLSPTDPKLAYSQALFYSLLYDEVKDPKEKNEYKEAAFQELNLSLALKKDFTDAITLKKSLEEKYK